LMNRRDVQEYRRGLGFIFQDFKLIPTRTVVENITFVPEVLGVPANQRGRRAFQVLKWVGLQHRMNSYPADLSGGEQQRVAIARAIAKQPDVLLCDEPTGALDLATGVVVLEAIARVNEELGTTTVVITHNAAVADMADRVISLADGHIVQERRNERRAAAAELQW